jgi:hypothetical protein
MIWIRFVETGADAKFRRHHAVLTPGEKDGVAGYWTYCGRFQRYEGVRDVADAPRNRCRCCRGRILHPYLIDPSLSQIAARAAS